MASVDPATLDKLGIKQSGPWLDIIVPIVGGLFCGVCGYLLTTFTNTLAAWAGVTAGLILWIGFYLIVGIKIIPSQNIWIIEQFGKYRRQVGAGWHILCLPGFVDQVVNDKIKTNRQELPIVGSEKETAVEIDFNCGSSAPVLIEVWFQIKNPILWHYRTDNPVQWLHDQVNAFLQPILERRTLDEARKQKRALAIMYRSKEDREFPEFSIHFINSEAPCQKSKPKCLGCDDCKESFRDYVEKRIGISWSDLLITDIRIPADIQELRKLTLAATKDREARKMQSVGYVGAIHGIMQYAENELKNPLTFEEAAKIYNLNKDREAFEKSGANITIVGQDVANMIATLFPKK